MWKTLKRKIALFLWEHSTKNKPMIPKGTVDTTLLHSQTENFLEQLKVYLQEDPDTYRKMQLNSYYAKNCCPDFNEAVCSHLYVSRLCSIYALQYYVMYSLLIQALLEKNIHELGLLVFGCGSMIDSLSLSFALREFEDSFQVHYTGVDIARWEATYSNPFETLFIQKPLQHFLDDTPSFDGNIIFFPTVISELSEYPDETGQFCEGLENTELLSDTIFLLVSYRSNASFNKDWKITDWQKIQRILSTLEKKGYSAEPLKFSVSIDGYFFGRDVENNELNWVDWSFKVLTRSDSLKKIDSCAQECIRYVGSGGKRNNSKYRVRYKTMCRMGYRTLVHAFYHGVERNAPAIAKTSVL